MEVKTLFTPTEEADSELSILARGCIGSEILKIASDVRAMKAKGAAVCNLTVGDFDPAYFPIPQALLAGTKKALDEAHTNYPPSDGMLALREAVIRFYSKRLGLTYPVESVLIAGGARPMIYGAYQTLVDPGDKVLYPVPSWNNHNYCQLVGAQPVEIPGRKENGFFPIPDDIRPHIEDIRMIVLNSPLNPTGTVISADLLGAITAMAVEENRRRKPLGKRPVFILYDQVYWTLTFGNSRHFTPVELVPECAPYTIMLDAVSKSFCGTGVRVGWGVMPPAIKNRMADIAGHVGAWAPRAEQVSTGLLLLNSDEIDSFHSSFKAKLQQRLDAIHEGFEAMRAEGLPVETIPPQGAIYLSARIDLFGMTWKGKTIETNNDIRKVLLEEAGVAVVPFGAFGLKGETGWVRLSVGSVSIQEIEAMMPRLRDLLLRITSESAA